MGILNYFVKKDNSARVATDRLQLILAHERTAKIPYMEQMKQEILAVVKKYTNTDNISIKADSNQDISTLEVEIILDNTK
ncbi:MULTISPECIES: cell division topological specificity factor MinE [Helicobacter]|uniref:Cell division topological specificity factor n=1 Tax=Helicobacter macacae MIT 99-5501 TaxID=1357400 RepID=V8C644_9HELI|nr:MULTISPECIES: cell division topological specificity factor MinE [Helicobacter]ETD22226.1 cell division topological specificity factor MinE [Helicobacter macacae MIT 99-5501]RDU54759.1 cell division topological specificity factor MinE [Helicobacter sp. MIT 01-3238]